MANASVFGLARGTSEYANSSNEKRYQALLDQSTPFVLYRWVSTGVLLGGFFTRIFVAQGWYIGTTVYLSPSPRNIAN